MQKLTLVPFAAMALATACADGTTTAPLKATGGQARFTVSPTPERTFAYVANTTSDNVSVIRTSDNTVVATIPVGHNPRGVGITPNGGRVYVANRSSDNVSVIRTSDNTVMATIPVGHTPQDIAVAPDGSRVFVTNADVGSVSVIRTSDNTVATTIDTGDDASDIAITPDGSEIFVNYGLTTPASPPFPSITGAVTSAFRTSDYTLRGSITWGFGVSPNAVAITPDGSRAYFPVSSVFPPTSLLRVTQTSNLSTLVTTELPNLFGSSSVTISPNGAYAFVVKRGFQGFSGTCSPGGVWIIPTATNTIENTVTVTCFPKEIAFTPDGTRAYVTNTAQDGSGNVTLISTSQQAVVGSVAVGTAPNGIAIAFVPTAKQVAGGLQDLVDDLDVANGIKISLQAKLTEVMAAIDGGTPLGACVPLDDFMNQVKAQSGKKISTTDAAALIDAAAQTRDLIGC